MKKALIIIGAVVALIVIAGVVFREALQFALMSYMIQPAETFADTEPPPAPDYANPGHWAALPERQDLADVTPSEAVQDNQADAEVDVFFVHPTTYYEDSGWNQDLADAPINAITDYAVMRNQASVFNGCCRIYAPRYRQATLYSFFDRAGGGQDAIDFAYQDVAQAFRHYMDHENQGRPFILAGHSQGALHLDTLLREEMQGSPAAERMIAAYPIGYYLDGSNGFPVCQSAQQTGCQVSWNALAPEVESFNEVPNPICVNPLTWRTDGAYADFSANLGAVSYGFDEEDESPSEAIEPGVADAQCIDGELRVTEVRSEEYPPFMSGEGNYHMYDLNLFHMNLRANAVARTEAFLSAQAAAAEEASPETDAEAEAADPS